MGEDESIVQTWRTRKLSDIYGCVQSLHRLSPVISILEYIRCGTLAPNATKVIAEHFANIGKMFEGQHVPGLTRIREAVESQASAPSDDWCGWFRGIVKARKFDEPGVQAIAGQLDAELDNLNQVLTELPPQVRRVLGPEFDVKCGLWHVRVRLRDPATAVELDDALSAEVEAAGGPTKYTRTCSRWWQIGPCLQDPRWKVDWPDAPAIIQRIDQVLNKFEARGQTDFSATPRLVRQVIRRILRREHPAWLPCCGDDPIERQVEEKLVATILAPPGALSPEGLRSAVQRELEPLEVPETLIRKALEQLLEEGLIHSREIRHRASGWAEPQVRLYFCRGRGAGSENVDRGRDNSRLGRGQEPAKWAENIFRRCDDFWEVRFQGEPTRPARIAHRVGMQRLHQLLLSPGKPIPAIDLVTDKKPTAAPRAAGPEHAEFAEGAQGDTYCTWEDLAVYRRQHVELDQELEMAKQENDEAELERIQRDKDFLLKVIREATDGRGKLRRQVDPVANRARKTVSATVKSAIEKIREYAPKLAAHLDDNIDHGLSFRYRPQEPVQWDLS